jgi:hypothetical protein
MEITEIVSYFINEDSNTLEVTFRTTDDSENEARVDAISLKEAKEFGYTLISESFDFFSDDDDDTEDYDDEEFLDVDEDELTNFLNEYYLVHPNRLPISEFF